MNTQLGETSGAAANHEISTDDVQPQGQYAFPCTIVQRACWFYDRTAPGNSTNNIAVRFKLEGKLDVPLLERALQQVVERHEVLRTRFVMHGGEPKQIVEPEIRFALTVSSPGGKSEAERIAAEEAKIGFDLATGPLFRGHLLRMAGDEHMLLLTMHHIVSDGWSIGLVTEEMGAIYEALVLRREPVLPDLSIQYADYACWQEEWEKSGELEIEIAYLKQRLDGFTPIHIPTDFERPDTPTHSGEIRSIVLPRKLTDRIKDLAEQDGCTFFVAMYAAFLTLMRHETGQDDIVLRTPAAGRGRMEMEPLIGWFVNPLILRNEVPGGLTFRELLRSVRETVFEAFQRQDVPFERLMEVVRPKLSGHRHPPFQVNFILQRDFVKPWSRAGVTMTALPSKSAGVFVDLNFFLVEREDGWRASIDVSTELFRVETGEAILESYRRVLEQVIAEPAKRIADFVLPRPDRKKPQPEFFPSPDDHYLAPRNSREREIVAIWERLLDFSPIGVHSNFFDLGGHSVLATKLTAEMQKAFGHEIHLQQLFVNPTPAAMALLIDAPDTVSTGEKVIRIQPHGQRRPFFMIGGDHWFRPFALQVGEDQPFFGVPLNDFGKLAGEPHRQEVAREIANLMMSSFPKMEFVLGGWCDAGVTAFEVARAILDAGGRVGLVVMFDSMNPEYYWGLQGMAASTTKALSHFQDTLKEERNRGFLSSVTSAARVVGHGLKRGAMRLPHLFNNTETGNAAFPILLMRPTTHGVGDPELGWRRVSPSALTVIEVPGDHTSLFEKHNANVLARMLRKELDDFLAGNAEEHRKSA